MKLKRPILVSKTLNFSAGAFLLTPAPILI